MTHLLSVFSSSLVFRLRLKHEMPVSWRTEPLPKSRAAPFFLLFFYLAGYFFLDSRLNFACFFFLSAFFPYLAWESKTGKRVSPFTTVGQLLGIVSYDSGRHERKEITGWPLFGNGVTSPICFCSWRTETQASAVWYSSVVS
ncbi:hypothetical protein L209DRAFT_501202 [Thermothelomyces heterothallicus CBS 203.75]